MFKIATLITFALIMFLPFTAFASYRQVPLVTHVQSTFSDDGVLSMDEIAATAEKQGVKVVIMADHDIMECEYGLFPLCRIIKKKVGYCSVLQADPQKYLDAIAAANAKHKDVILIPGVESTPFYYWTGSAFNGGLTLNDWHKHMLVAGLYEAAQYRKLPVLGNEKTCTETDYSFVWPLLAVITGIFVIFIGARAAGLAIIAAGVIFLFNGYPFHKIPFDQYHGPQGEKPYQAMIDYVNNTAPDTGMIFWAHPEAPNFSAPQKIGPILAKTGMYPESLYNTYDYTGFAYFQEGYRTAGKAGGVWDRVLMDFCGGKRKSPVWAISELDYRKEGYLGTYMDSYKNILLFDNKDEYNSRNIIKTMRSGRFYLSVKPRNSFELVLDRFELRHGTVTATMGENIFLPGIPGINDIMITEFHASDGRSYPTKTRLIVDGKVLMESEMGTPAIISFSARQLPASGKSYCRLEINAGNNSAIVTNPIFFERK